MALTPEQAQQLLEKGWIQQGTYDLAVPPAAPIVPNPTPIVQTPVKSVRDIAYQGADDFVKSVNRTGASASFEIPEAKPPEVDLPVEREVATADVSQDPSMQALNRLASLGMKEADLGYKQAQYESGMLKGLEEQQAKLQERQAEINSAKQKAMEEGQSRIRQAEETASRMEPTDYWQDKGAGSKVAAAIAMAFGSYASSINGGPNTAAQIIDSTIQRDMALQKERYQRAKEKGISARSALADNLAIFKDQESAELATMQNYYNLVGTRIKAAEAKTNSEVAKNNAQRFSAEIDLKKAELYQKLTQRQNMINLEKALKSGKQVDPSLLDEKQLARYVEDPEFGGLARTEQAANKISETLIQYRDSKQGINDLLEIAGRPAKSLSPELRAKANLIATSLKGSLRSSVLGPGQVTESERAILDKVVRDPTEIFSMDATNIATLKELSSNLDKNMYNTARAYGINPKVQTTDSNSVIIRTSQGKNMKIPRVYLPDAKRIAEQAGTSFEVVE